MKLATTLAFSAMFLLALLAVPTYSQWGHEMDGAVMFTTTSAQRDFQRPTPGAGNSGGQDNSANPNNNNDRIVVAYGDHYYEVVKYDAPIGWIYARAEAHRRSYKNLGGYLAAVSSKDENDAIIQLLTQNGFTTTSDIQWFWMGASDWEREGVWRWIEGEDYGKLLWTQAQGCDQEFCGWAGEHSCLGAEPSNSSFEDHLAMAVGSFYTCPAASKITYNYEWVDLRMDDEVVKGYIIEYGTPLADAPMETEDSTLAPSASVEATTLSPVVEATTDSPIIVVEDKVNHEDDHHETNNILIGVLVTVYGLGGLVLVGAILTIVMVIAWLRRRRIVEVIRPEAHHNV